MYAINCIVSIVLIIGRVIRSLNNADDSCCFFFFFYFNVTCIKIYEQISSTFGYYLRQHVVETTLPYYYVKTQDFFVNILLSVLIVCIIFDFYWFPNKCDEIFSTGKNIRKYRS